MKTITRLLATITVLLNIGVHCSRSELIPNQEYIVYGYAFDAEQYTAQLDVPEGIELVSTPVITATQAISYGVTFNWRIRVMPSAQRNSLLPLTMTVNGQQAITQVRVTPDPPTQFNRVYLPIVYNFGR